MGFVGVGLDEGLKPSVYYLWKWNTKRSVLRLGVLVLVRVDCGVISEEIGFDGYVLLSFGVVLVLTIIVQSCVFQPRVSRDRVPSFAYINPPFSLCLLSSSPSQSLLAYFQKVILHGFMAGCSVCLSPKTSFEMTMTCCLLFLSSKRSSFKNHLLYRP